MSNRFLPDPFEELEPFVVKWSLAKETDRRAERASSAMHELQVFYDTMLPRMETIIEYLNQYPLDDVPAKARRLLYLTLSLAEVAPAVEFYKRPLPVGVFDHARFVALHDSKN